MVLEAGLYVHVLILWLPDTQNTIGKHWKNYKRSSREEQNIYTTLHKSPYGEKPKLTKLLLRDEVRWSPIGDLAVKLAHHLALQLQRPNTACTLWLRRGERLSLFVLTELNFFEFEVKLSLWMLGEPMIMVGCLCTICFVVLLKVIWFNCCCCFVWGFLSKS